MVNRSVVWLVAKVLLVGCGAIGVCGCDLAATLQDAASIQFESALTGFINQTISAVVFDMFGLS